MIGNHIGPEGLHLPDPEPGSGRICHELTTDPFGNMVSAASGRMGGNQCVIELALDFTEALRNTVGAGYGLASLTINGVDFHVEIIEIEPCRSCYPDSASPARHWCSDTKAVNPEWEDQLCAIYEAWGGDGPWAAIEDQEGRQFVVLILPYCT